MRRRSRAGLVSKFNVFRYSLIYEYSSVNVPWPCAGVGDADYIYAFQKVILPIGLEFAPDLVMSKSTQTAITRL